MSGNHDRGTIDAVEHGLTEIDDAGETAAVVRIDERVAAVVEDVAHMDDVGVGKDDGRVAFGMRRAHMEKIDRVAVEMNAHALVVCENRQCGRRVRRLLDHLVDDIDRVVLHQHAS